MKHGAILSDHDDVPSFKDYVAGPIHFKPVNWFERKQADGDQLGNDIFCCTVPAADYRLIGLWGGRCTREQVLHRYSKLTGFDPIKPETDKGLDTHLDLMDWCEHPILDGAKLWSVVHAKIDPADSDQILRALTRMPLLITLRLPVAIAERPELWHGSIGTGKNWKPVHALRAVLGAWDCNDYLVAVQGQHVKVSAAMMGLCLAEVDVVIPRPGLSRLPIILDGIDFRGLSARKEIS